MTTIRWGIIGPGAIAHNFADGLAESQSGALAAVCGRDAERRNTFADRYAIPAAKRYAGQPDLLADPEIDAIYISTPHPAHAELAIAALRAGKAVLVEKPAALNAAEVAAIVDVATQQGRFFMEGFMYRCHPQIARMLEIIASGEIGAIRHITTRFGFSAGLNEESRLYSRALAGGGILDVGGYPVSFARLVAGASMGKPFAHPVSVRGGGVMASTGVDAVAYGVLVFENGVTAEIAAAVARSMDNSATIEGEAGTIRLDDPWVPGRNKGPSDATLHVTTKAGTRTETLADPRMLFAFEAELASRAIADGRVEAPYPAVGHADSISNNQVLDLWRAELGYKTIQDVPATNRRLPGTMPKGLPDIGKIDLVGLDRPMSRLIIGCDNRNGIAEGAVVWDAWMEAGGNAFDTGFVYGAGQHEKVLGEWIAARGVAKDIVVIAKGAHTPYCLPGAIEAQLDISLDRLGLSSVPIYIMHRDNPDVPVGEFADALNRLHAKGKIGLFGGSNWSVDRLKAFNDHAARHGLQPMRILNNNLSLAVMERPVWAGCISSHDDATLAFLRDSGTIHMSWSSQARGYFLPEALRNRLPADTAPETCFGSAANAERRKRAEELADRHGVSAHNVALAWVLAQDFASLALVGPRSPAEIASTLPALGLQLSRQEIDWLDLKTG